MSKVFKVEAMGDTLFFLAPNLEEASEQFDVLCGEDVPPDLLRWSEATKAEIKRLETLPPEEAYAPDLRHTTPHSLTSRRQFR